ncbi:MAG: phosphoenolpyruvate phosphomutase [Chloroflexi bacterium]|nr:phosphoenolpyruvate phosphomutase [Chloroflexota bacterium]|tara:strand:- start:1059 stop:1958 length:900 start_codon:yes stop_codon:yes gene_type:complete
MSSATKQLRDKIKEKSLLKIGGAFDAMSAKLVEITNFDAVWAGSFAISATHAVPDASIMTMTEFLQIAKNMVDSCDIPIIADCDTGFGGPSNVSHLVKQYEQAGVAGISIEDKIFPKQNSLLENGKQELLSEKDFVAKIIAGKESKVNSDFLIIARTEALIAGFGVDEALKRATAYENAGADAILIHSKSNTPKEIFQFCDSWSGKIPLVVVPTTYGSVTTDELVKHNIKMVIYANQTLRIAHKSMMTLLEKLNKANNLDEVKEDISTMEEIFELQKMFEIHSQEKDIERKLKNMGYIN